MVVSLLESQWAMQNLMDLSKGPEFLSIDDATQFLALCDALLEDYTRLINDADENSVLLWSVTPKFHWLWHLAYRAQYLNPQKGCCMLDEDFVGICKIIVRSCSHGTEATAVPTGFVEKYRWGIHFRNVHGDVYVVPT